MTHSRMRQPRRAWRRVRRTAFRHGCTAMLMRNSSARSLTGSGLTTWLGCGPPTRPSTVKRMTDSPSGSLRCLRGVLRPRFSWTRIKGESDVQGGSGNGSVEEGAGSWVGADGGSPKGDRSRRRPSGGCGPGLGARAAVKCEPEVGRGGAAVMRRVTRRGLACSRGGDLSAGGVEGAGGGRSRTRAEGAGRLAGSRSAGCRQATHWGTVDGERAAVGACPRGGASPPFGDAEVAMMSATTSATTGRRYGLERVCRTWERSGAAFYGHCQTN